MLKKLTILLSLVLTLGFAASTSAAAQDLPEVESPDFEGLESGYARMYMPDFNAMIAAMSTPGADAPDLATSVLAIQTSILTFDNADSVQKAVDQVTTSFETQGTGDIELTSEEIDDLGDTATIYTGDVDVMGSAKSLNVLIVQEAEQLVLVQVIGGEADASASQARDIAQFIMDTEPSTDEVTFNEDGTSTGGAFDRMPTAEDTDLIGHLAPFMDIDMTADTTSTGN